MGINKVEFGGNVLIDLTQDTVSPRTMMEGTIAHNMAGDPIVGAIPDKTDEVLKDIKDLKKNKINYTDIVDDLDTAASDKPLSANQGYIIGQMLDSLFAADDETIDELDRLLTFINQNKSSITDLTSRLNALVDTDDTTLDQLSEIVAYIKNNKTLIDNITTSKVSVSDIVDNLTSTATNKPLSANQGRELGRRMTAAETSLGEKVDKVTGKGLSTNDYTTAEKNKLKDIEAGAEVNVQPDWDVTDPSSDAYIKHKPASLPANGGTAKTISDTLPISKGGTGKTNAADAFKALLDGVGTGDSTPSDNDWYLSQYANGSGETPPNEKPIKRKMLAIWNYIKAKLTKSSVGLGNVDNTADADKNVKSANKLNESDTRAVNSPPSYYMQAARSKGIITEFKNKTSVGLTGEGFVQVTTFCQWSDSTGGYPAQIVTGDSDKVLRYRVGTSSTNWSDWNRLKNPTRVKGNAETAYREGDVNLTPANIGALSTGGGTVTGAINGIISKSIGVPDNSGMPKYLLLFDVTTWYNSTTTDQATNSFTGIIFSSREGGHMRNGVEHVYAGVSWSKVTSEDGFNLMLRTTRANYIPCIIKNNSDSKYYLAIRVTDSGRGIVLMGRFAGTYIGTWVNGSDNSWSISGYSIALNNYRFIGAPKLDTARYIDGVAFDGSSNIVHSGTCSTAAGTAAKVVACSGFSLIAGASIKVKFTVTNTAANPTLNVNNTGAKAVFYRGSAISAGYLAANRVYEFIYDGTNYEFVGDINVDTHGFNENNGTIAEADLDTFVSRKSGTYGVQRSGDSAQLTVLARRAGSASALEFYHTYQTGLLRFRSTIDNNRYAAWQDLTIQNMISNGYLGSKSGNSDGRFSKLMAGALQFFAPNNDTNFADGLKFTSHDGNTVLGMFFYEKESNRFYLSKSVWSDALGVLKLAKVIANLEGTADKATNDADGNKISSTYLKLNGNNSMTGNLVFAKPSAATDLRGIEGIMADNDRWRVKGGGSASDSGFLEIATCDNGNEPIYVRQYNGAFTTLVRTLILLDASGNTTLPGSISATNLTNVQNTKDADKNVASALKLRSRGQVAAETGTTIPAIAGISMTEGYNNGYPAAYGNIISLYAQGAGEIFCEWSGSNGGIGHLQYRNKRDVGTAEWSPWRQLAFTTDTVAAATKATQDGDGKVIKDTYLKISGNRSRRLYDINLSSYSTSNFYAITFEPSGIELDCEIYSREALGSDPWNTNVLHFLLTSQGWSDVPISFVVLNHSTYSTSEITIASVVRGIKTGRNAVYLRGGLTYKMYSNAAPSIRTANFTGGNETFPSGTATCYKTGFTAAEVLMDFTVSGNTGNFSYFRNRIKNYVTTTEVPFSFGIDSNGNYGYKKAGADTVTPFLKGVQLNASAFQLDPDMITTKVATPTLENNTSNYYIFFNPVSGYELNPKLYVTGIYQAAMKYIECTLVTTLDPNALKVFNALRLITESSITSIKTYKFTIPFACYVHAFYGRVGPYYLEHGIIYEESGNTFKLI